MERYPVFTKKGTDLYSEEDKYLGKGYFKNDVKYEKGKQKFYLLSYGNILDSKLTLEAAKRSAKVHAERSGDEILIVKVIGKYTSKW